MQRMRCEAAAVFRPAAVLPARIAGARGVRLPGCGSARAPLPLERTRDSRDVLCTPRNLRRIGPTAGSELAVARSTYFGRIARGAKGAAADAVLSPPKLLFRPPPPRLPFAAGDFGSDLIDDDAANQRSSP